MNFSAAQRKIILAAWSLVLLVLYTALLVLGNTGGALVLSFFVIVPMQITCISFYLFTTQHTNKLWADVLVK